MSRERRDAMRAEARMYVEAIESFCEEAIGMVNSGDDWQVGGGFILLQRALFAIGDTNADIYGELPRQLMISIAESRQNMLDEAGRMRVGCRKDAVDDGAWAWAVLIELQRMRVGRARLLPESLPLYGREWPKRSDSERLAHLFHVLGEWAHDMQHVLGAEREKYVAERFRQVARDLFPAWQAVKCDDDKIIGEMIDLWHERRPGRRPTTAGKKQPKWGRLAEWCGKALTGAPKLSAKALDEADRKYRRGTPAPKASKASKPRKPSPSTRR